MGRRYRELTLRSVAIGIAMGVILNVAFVYAALQLGFAIGGSTVAAIIGLPLFGKILQHGTTIENNINQTVASCINTTGSGIVFTVPAIFMYDAAQRAKGLPGIDFEVMPLLIGAIGGSSAGHLVAMLGALNGDGDSTSSNLVEQQTADVQSIIARAGVYNFIGAGQILNLFGHFVPETDDGSPEARAAIEASPVTHISPGYPPTLLVHGTEDNMERSQELHDALQAIDTTVKLIPIEGAGHGPSFPNAKIDISEIQAHYVSWFDQHLRNA